MRSTAGLMGIVLLACCQALPAAEKDSVWEIRRAHAPDQTEEWTQQGYLPAWEVKVGPGPAPAIEIGGDAKGAFRGIVLVGRRWRVPAPLPAEARVRLEYQTRCAMDEPGMQRAGQAYLVLFTPERWQQFASEPARAEKLNLQAGDPGIVAVAAIHTAGEDVTAWREWQSANLAPRLRGRVGQDLVLAVAWSGMHFHAEEWAKFRAMETKRMTQEEADRTLLESLDLEREDLREVKRALAAGDLAAAKAALATHLRTRQRPVGPVLSPDGSANGVRAADDIVKHVFSFVGCPPTPLGETILWNEDPHNYDQWPIAFNRHTHWVTLGRAYAATHDEKYAREFVAQLNGWVAAMPVYMGRNWVQGPFFESGKAPLTLDAGIRMGQTWWPAYYYFKDSPAFDAESQFRMIRSLREHALYLMDPQGWHPSSNWGAMEVAGLFTLAVMLPEFKESGEWMRTARERLVQAYEAQVYPDGAQMELTPGYHGVTLGNFLDVLDVAQRNGISLPAEWVAGLERMFEYYVAIAAPDGRGPALNDSGPTPVRGMLARGFRLFPARRDFEYLATAGAKGTPPAATSWALPYAGWYMMRTGWGPDDRWLHFEAGPFGAAHQHEDKLSILIHAGRKTLLTEGGVYSYDTSDWRRYVLSTRAHNTVMVDGLEQNRATQKGTHVVRQPAPSRWQTNADFDYAEGVYDSGYGPQNAARVSHTRQVVFVKPDYWLVFDTMKPADDAPHQYEALFHLDAEDAEVDPGTRAVTVESEGSGLRIIPLHTEGVEVEIVKGRHEAPVQGWLPTGRHNVLRPIPTAVFRWRAAGPSTLAYALVPRERGKEWPAQGVRLLAVGKASLAAEVLLPGGAKDLVARCDPDGAPLPVASLLAGAEVVVVRKSADGAPGTALRVIGQLVN